VKLTSTHGNTLTLLGAVANISIILDTEAATIVSHVKHRI